MDSSWLTPTVLFCFLNLIIICIFFASYSKSHNHQLGQHDSPQLNRSSSLLARVKSINFSFKNFDHHYPFEPENQEVKPEDGHVQAITEKELSVSEPVETVSFEEKKEEVTTTESSVKERKKKLSVSEPVRTVSFKEKEEVMATESIVKERKKKLSVREPKKTVSFKGDEEVDAKADDFINRFKQQLKMQRLDSIKRYTEMLTGGARSTN